MYVKFSEWKINLAKRTKGLSFPKVGFYSFLAAAFLMQYSIRTMFQAIHSKRKRTVQDDTAVKLLSQG